MGFQGERLRTVSALAVLIYLLSAGLTPATLQAQKTWTSKRSAATGEYHLVAVRVSFQPDSSRFTTGNGTFDDNLFEGLSPSIEPFPHDEAYVRAHLDFLADYLAKASNGRVSVVSHILPDEVRVSNPMSAYSPIGENAGSDEEVSKLAALVDEVWALAANQTAGLSLPQGRTAFVIVHAGVGRDIELVGTTLDKTPFDLPSLFFDVDRLRDFGVSRSFADVEIDNTMIIPRTQTRRGFDFVSDQPFLAEFSVNGLLAASFLNFLGAPDLFDTESGQSAIGPFGLMDPLGIFSFRGLMPPFPSAWTRQYLGWIDVVDASTGINLIASASSCGPICAHRVPVSSSEYFLVENRFRGSGDSTLSIDVWEDGVIRTQQFSNDDPDFNYRSVNDFSGVLVSASNYDFALPGGVDEDGNDLVGGILIWHVDDRLVSNNLEGNALNVAENGRAVDLEEADSGQDLGHPNANPFAPNFDLGSPFDFYYFGNPVSVITSNGEQVALYTNRFDGVSFPNSDHNGGGASSVELFDFSEPGSTMSYELSRVSAEEAQMVVGFPFEVIPPFPLPPLFSSNTGARTVQIGGTGDRVLVKHSETDPSYVVDETVPRILLGLNNGWSVEAGEGDLYHFDRAIGQDSIRAVRSQSVGQFEQLSWALPTSGAAEIVGPVSALSEDRFALIYEQNGQSAALQISGSSVELVDVASQIGEPISISVLRDELIVAGRLGVQSDDFTWIYPSAIDSNSQIVTGIDVHGILASILDRAGRQLLLMDSIGVRSVDLTRLGLESGVYGHPLIADVDGDALLDVILFSDKRLVALSRSGGTVGSTPQLITSPIVGQPIVVKRENQTVVIIYNDSDGYLHARLPGDRWREIDSFPLASGRYSGSPYFDDGRLYVGRESLSVWETDFAGDVLWAGLYGSSANNHSVDLGAKNDQSVESLLVEAETYNWPNPIRAGVTNFRLQAGESGTAEIFVVDMAGNHIDTIEGIPVIADVPVEREWSAMSVSSGVYFARVSFTSVDGQTDNRLIRVAVIK